MLPPLATGNVLAIGQNTRPRIRLFHRFVVIPVRRVNWHGFITVADCIFSRHRDGGFVFAGHCQIPVELLDAQVPQVFISEEVFLGERQVELWVWVIGNSRDMPGVTQIPIFFLADEARRRVLTRFGTSHHVEIQQTVEAHAYPDRPALQPIFEAVLFRLHEIPFSGLLAYLVA